MQLAAQIWQSRQGTAQAVDELLAAHLPGEDDPRGFEWRYQWTLLHRGAAVFRTSGAPATIAVAANGSLVAIDADRQLWGWDRTSRTPRRHLDLSAARSPRQIALTADGRTVAVGTSDGTVTLLDVATGRARRVIKVSVEPLLQMRFLADDRTLLTQDLAGTARLSDAVTGELKERTPGAKLFGILSPDGQMLARLNSPRGDAISLVHWKAADRNHPLVLQSSDGTLISAALSPNDKILTTSHLGGAMVLWEVSTGKRLAKVQADPAAIDVLTFSPNGKLLATGGRGGEVRLWDMGAAFLRTPPRRLKGQAGPITRLAFSADGQRLASGAGDGTIRLWDLSRSGDVRTLVRLRKNMSAAVYSPDGRWLAAGSGDGTAKVWDADTGRLVRVLRVTNKTSEVPWSTVTHVAFSPAAYRRAGWRLLATGDLDGQVILWEVTSGRALHRLVGPRYPSRPDRQGVVSLAFSPDGSILAVGFGSPYSHEDNYDQEIKLWDVASGGELRTLKARNNVAALAFSSDGGILAAGSYDHTVKLWAVGSWKEICALQHDDMIESVALSPSNKMLAAEEFLPGRILIWELPSGRVIHRLNAHAIGVQLAFSPDGRTLASTGWDGTIKLWDPVTGRELRVLDPGPTPKWGVTFSPDGNTLAAAQFSDNTVRLWKAASPQEIAADIREERRTTQQAERHRRETEARSALQVVASGSEAGMELQWRPWSRAVGYNVYRGPTQEVPGATSPIKLNPQPVAGTTFTDRHPGLTHGRTVTYTITPLVPQEGRLVPAERVSLQFTPVAMLPGWTGTSINEGPWRSGSVFFRSGYREITLRGSGADIWGETDGCYFLNRPVTGAFRISAKVRTLPVATEEWAKAGLMIRGTLAASACQTTLVTTPANGLFFVRRLTPGGSSDGSRVLEASALRLPILLRLTRRGNSVTASYSMDEGRSFHSAGAPVSFTAPLPQTVYAGLAITADDDQQISEAKFSDLVIQQHRSSRFLPWLES